MARRPKPWFREARDAWFVTINGVQHNLGPSKKAAFDRFYELMRQPVPRPVDAQSVVAVIDLFLEWVQSHRSPDTYEWYRHRLQRFAEKYPTLRVSDLKPFHAQQWVEGFASLSITTRRNYLRTIKRCMAWAVRQGYIERSPLVSLELPAGERRETVLTQQEFEQLLELAGDQSFRDLLVVTWEMGCRPQEALRVEARHVDLTNQRWVFPQSESKGKREPRVVYLTDKACSITKKLMERFPTGSLFRNSNGVPFSTDAVNCCFARVQIRMGALKLKSSRYELPEDEIVRKISTLKPTRFTGGIEVNKSDAELRDEARRKLLNKKAAENAPRYSLYALRHSWATKALKSGLDGLTVAILMGHSDPSTLARVYQHLSHDPQHLLSQARRANAGAK